ncbi:hypothetical protein T492DRAFT_863221 [Pavlovales sp. CCMP2436]|nr:hypothetical protein T492DRAFT_863221 [Pavlovales sp. CCMP2436]
MTCAQSTVSKQEVMAHFRSLMYGPVAEVFARAERHELCAESAPSAKRLAPLDGGLKGCMLEFSIAERFVRAWSVANTHFWQCDAAGRFDSPVLLIFNCAPGYCADDGDAVSDLICRWTPEVVPAIVDQLLTHGAWPAGVLPLVSNFRCICPALVSRSFWPNAVAGDGTLGRCGNFAEGESTPDDRQLYGQFTRVLHGSTRAWLRIAHARPSRVLIRAGYGGGVGSAAGVDGLAFAAPAGSTGRAFIGLSVHHPGHDAHLHGALLRDNVRAWAAAGTILLRFGEEMSEADGRLGVEIGAELAERIVHFFLADDVVKAVVLEIGG